MSANTRDGWWRLTKRGVGLLNTVIVVGMVAEVASTAWFVVFASGLWKKARGGGCVETLGCEETL